MQDIKKKTDEKEDPAVEHFCSLYARIALQVAGSVSLKWTGRSRYHHY